MPGLSKSLKQMFFNSLSENKQIILPKSLIMSSHGWAWWHRPGIPVTQVRGRRILNSKYGDPLSKIKKRELGSSFECSRPVLYRA